ncbi:MAG: hypothetical protein EU547_03325 [Promethearchaeota archaeon]|nr:MAG: hypothetical protein EU547_03325 [Candidatus Lokiarchaeota archaeon]
MTGLKDLIDSVEEKNQNTIELENKIEFLKNTINRLKFTIKEQKRLVEELKESETNKDNIPNDVKILKELVSSQREDLKSKDKIISRLEIEIQNLKEQLSKKEKFLSESIDKKQYSDLKGKVQRLLKEKEESRIKIRSLKSRLKQFEADNSKEKIIKKLNEANIKINDLIHEKENSNAQISFLEKRLENIKDSQSNQAEMKQELVKLRAQIANEQQEKQRLINKIELLQKELNETRAKIDRQKQEKEELIGQIDYFQEELENLKSKKLENFDKNNLMEDIYSQFTKEKGLVSKSLTNYEQRIFELENLVEQKEVQIKDLKRKLELYEQAKKEFKMVEEIAINEEIHSNSSPDVIEPGLSNQTKAIKNVSLDVENVPQFYQKNLIEYMFNIMNQSHKKSVIDFLIQNLDNNDPQIRRFTIKILSRVRTSKVFNALIDRISDKDWLVRFYLVKALKSFSEFNGVKQVLNEYLNDADVDVREAAKDALKEIP